MFDIGFMELLLISIIALVVMGPQRLPQAVRTITLWLGRARQFFTTVRKELENEVGMDDIKRQLHNEQILRDLKSSKSELTNITRIDTISDDISKDGENNTFNKKPDSNDNHT